jgi:hypothetical protein
MSKKINIQKNGSLLAGGLDTPSTKKIDIHSEEINVKGKLHLHG